MQIDIKLPTIPVKTLLEWNEPGLYMQAGFDVPALVIKTSLGKLEWQWLDTALCGGTFNAFNSSWSDKFFKVDPDIKRQ